MRFALLLLAIPLGATPLATLQANYVNQRCGAIFHWGMPTYAVSAHGGAEPAPDTNVDVFAPTGLDIDQWLDTVVAAGCKYATITTKHGGGFALWPTAHHVTGFLPYSIAQTAWYAANGSPDVIGLFASKARSRGLNVVLYFNMRDSTYEVRSNTTAATGTADYIAMEEAELTELLTNYGSITAIWTDGWGYGTLAASPGASAVGGVGVYTYIPFATIYNFVKGLQPDCLLIENDHAHPAVRSDIEVYEQEVVPNGNTRPSESMNTIRPDGDWFFVANDTQDGVFTRAPRLLAAEMAQKNANHATYTVDLTPNRAGVIPSEQVLAFTGWRTEERWVTNVALGKSVTSSSIRAGCYSAASITDDVLISDVNGNYCNVFFSAIGADQFPWIEIDLGSSILVSRVEIVGLNNAQKGGQLRDLTVTVYDSSHTAVYASATINAANSGYAGSYVRGPGQVTDTPAATGRYVRVSRAGTGASEDLSELALLEVQVFSATRNSQARGALTRRGATGAR